MQIETQRYLKRITDTEVWLDARTTQLSAAPAYAGLRTQLEAQEATIKAEF